jgi:hypothetical protein
MGEPGKLRILDRAYVTSVSAIMKMNLRTRGAVAGNLNSVGATRPVKNGKTTCRHTRR